MARNKHILHLLHHLFLGFALILKGYTKYHHHQVFGGLAFVFGLLVIGYFLFVLMVKKESRIMNISIHLFEAFVSLFTAYIFFEEGKTYIQYFFIAAAIGFLVAVYFSLRKKGDH